MPTGAFLDSKDLETFDQDRMIYARRLLPIDQAGRPSPQPMEETVKDRVANYLSETAHGFYCMAVQVYPGDGMSWSATVVDSVIEEIAPRTPRLHLQGRPGAGPRPALADVIALRRIAALAQKHGIAKSSWAHGTRRYVTILLAAIGVGAAASIANAEASGAGLSSSTLTLPFLGFAVASAALGMISQLLLQKLTQDSPTSALGKIAEDIAAQANSAEPSDGYWEFVDGLARQLGRFGEFRCLIVDDFTFLDNVTRHVLESYLRKVASDTRDEFWALFYSADDKRLELAVSRPERVNRRPTGYRHTHLFRLEHLDADQRRDLAIAYGAPERRAFVTVRAIARDDSGSASLAAVCQREYDDRGRRATDPREGDSLDFFYIFALNAASAGNPLMQTYRIRSTFSRKTRFRSPILQLLMPGLAPTPTAVSGWLDMMLATFFPLAGDVSRQSRESSFRVAPEAGWYMDEHWRQYDLPHPGLVHLFWTLYWSDTELHGIPGVALLRKVSFHLLNSTPPAELQARLKLSQAEFTAFSDELFNTTLRIIRSCLDICMLADIPDLMNYALRLSEDDRSSVERDRRSRLRPLAWQAYGLLGDERLLAVILDLDPATKLPSSPAGTGTDLMDLFLRTMPGADGDAGRLMRNELARQGMAKHAGTYAMTKAGWLAASLAPFLGPANRILTAAANDCRSQLPTVVLASVDNLQSVVDQEWRTTDILNVVLGLWSLTLTTQNSRAAPSLGWTRSYEADASLVDALGRVCVLAVDLADQRRSAEPAAGSLDLVLDCLAEEIVTVVLSAALLLLRCWPDSAWSNGAARGDVLDVVRMGAKALGINDQFLPLADGVVNPRLAEDARRQMTLLTVLWRRLGFNQLASFMTIRQAQFDALYYERDANLAQTTISLLGSDLEQADNVGLLAHLAAAEGSMFSTQLTSSVVIRGSHLSVSAGFSERTSAELCMMAIEIGSSFNMDFSKSIDFLLARSPESKERRLESLLAEVSEEDSANLLTKLLNCVMTDRTRRADELSTTLERWISKIPEPAIGKSADGTFRTFSVRRHMLLGQPVDVSSELDAWQDLRDLQSYAYLLALLLPLSSSTARDRVVRESLAVLKAKEPYINSSGFVHLAFGLLNQLRRSAGESDEAAIALSALRDGFNCWEQRLDAERNTDILRLLAHYDRDRVEDYRAKLLEWQQVILELDETQRLPELIGQGRYFLLVWHYFEFFAQYGMQSEPPMDWFGLDDQEAARALNDWRAGHRKTPDPIVGGVDDERLSGEYLRLGYALFRPGRANHGGDKTNEIEEGRRQFDEKAKESIETLYRMLGRLPRIPSPVEQILRRHEIFVVQRMNDLDSVSSGMS